MEVGTAVGVDVTVGTDVEVALGWGVPVGVGVGFGSGFNLAASPETWHKPAMATRINTTTRSICHADAGRIPQRIARGDSSRFCSGSFFTASGTIYSILLAS